MIDDCRIIWNEFRQDDHSGLDCEQYCLDKNHFRSYPYTVKYHYNSRGFRGAEWPVDIGNAIWCIGDSFTVGLGAPEEHSWRHVLSQATGRPTINVSMDGASNSWIARWAQAICAAAPGSTIVIHWSFTHRRERALRDVQDEIWQEFYTGIADTSWPVCNSWYDVDQLPPHVQADLRQDPRWDCYTQGLDLESLRRLPHGDITTNVEEDADYTRSMISAVEASKGLCNVVHSHVPKWHPVPLNINTGKWIDEFKQLDLARDGYHYDIKTAQLLVNNILKVLEI